MRLLPYLGRKAMYEKFKLDEPWDSKNNLALLEKMPKALVAALTSQSEGLHGLPGLFRPRRPLRIGQDASTTIGNIPDGASNTIFAVESSRAVPWTKPATSLRQGQADP